MLTHFTKSEEFLVCLISLKIKRILIARYNMIGYNVNIDALSLHGGGSDRLLFSFSLIHLVCSSPHLCFTIVLKGNGNVFCVVPLKN